MKPNPILISFLNHHSSERDKSKWGLLQLLQASAIPVITEQKGGSKMKQQ